MKKLYDKNLVENLYSNNYPSYNTFLELLKEGDFEQKHFAMTFISVLEKPSDIEFFIANVVDQDTKIRELASFKITDFISEDDNLMSFLDSKPDIILRTICDVNPQVCRNICSLLPKSKNKNYLVEQLLIKIQNLCETTKSIRTKTHKASKDLFNLYWSFYAIEHLIDENFEKNLELQTIIKECLDYKDYTIRERAAFLSKKLNLQDAEIKNKILSDENFYVRKVLEIN
ncbi:MAG: hypothetical protein PHE78_01345 [Candidatus Gastranaerophilales bacterium]|nr:hypothetical protein [Candidatus Gastranaerophilales bacterium]